MKGSFEWGKYMSVERRLVDALKSSNSKKLESIFMEIYETNYKLVYFCVANFIDNKEDIEEIVNDVFINFYNHLNNIKIEGNIKYYLTKSAKNSCINYLKKNKNKNILLDPQNLSNLIYTEYKYIDNQFINKLKKILTKEEYFIIFNHIVLGYKLKEIALNLNAPFNTIKSKYRRTLTKIKNEFGGEYYE